MLNFKKQRFKTDPSYYEPSILKTWIFEKFFPTNIPIDRTETIVTILESCPSWVSNSYDFYPNLTTIVTDNSCRIWPVDPVLNALKTTQNSFQVKDKL